MIGREFKVILVFVGVVLWLLPQEAQGEDTEIKSQLSYISKVVGAIESSMIKIKGDVRFVKRQAEKTIAETNLSAKRLNNLEEKVKRIENLLNAILVDVAKLSVSLESVEKDFGGLSRGSCSNTRLCRRKK
tara:strand:- start:376 stop:768 length:393 start_codon:yes stop_codon:yes gene_type:complete